MKQNFTLYLVIAFMLMGSGVYAQAGQGFYNTTNWRFSNPKQFGFTVLDVDYFDNNTALAVGSDGGIAKTTDGGSNWTYGPFTFYSAANVLQKPSFSDVHFVTADVAYAVGSSGCMAKTTDGGATWNFVITPLFNRGRNINSVWFINKDVGYIGGQHNTPDSLPKLYFTRDGGSTWDSIAAPMGGKSRIGYVNNPNLPPVITDVTAKDKEIYRIEFINDSTGYICGSGLSTYYPYISANSTTCAANTTTTVSGAHHASLVWKFTSGVLTDYSTSKERLGYSGIPTGTLTCTSRFASLSNTTQTYKAMNIVDDSTIVLLSFNNNIVLKIHTGKNDSTQNIAVAGLYEKGKYETLNFPYPPDDVPIPPTQTLFASNPYQIRKAANGKLFAAANSGAMWTSVDTGRTWVREASLPQGSNYSTLGTWALDIAPNGKFLSMGSLGVVADSVPGSVWRSNYVTTPLSASYSKMDFVDCNNGIVTGSSNITVTEDGGKTWIDKNRPDFASSYYNINGFAYPSLTRAYFAVSNGVVYFSPDKGTTLDPIFADPAMQMYDIATVGNDSLWAVGYSSYAVPAAQRTSKVFRSVDAGVNWTEYSGFPVGTLAPAFYDIEFPTSLVGYAAGTKDTVYKTIDGGVTWDKLPLPTPDVTPQITYTDLFALDANTVFLTGNGYPRKVVFKTTDGGATWTDISSNILTLGGGNLNGVLMHDLNNGYVVSPGGVLYKTTDGGTSWSIDIAPTASLFTAMAFAPKTVPAGIAMQNRRLFVAGPNISGAPIMEYGDSTNISVNTTEVITNANCTNASGGSIVINTTGGIAPYSYSINNGTFQSENNFTGLTQGEYTIAIKDAFCGLLTKKVTIAYDNNLVVTTAPNDTTVCSGAPVQLLATAPAGTSFVWSPATGLSASNINNPIATVDNNIVYTVTATLGTCIQTAVVNLETKAGPTVNAGADKTIVEGESVTLDGSGSTAGITSILWSPAASLSNAASLTPIAKPATTTVYTLTVKDNNNCTSSDQATVTVLPYCIKVLNAFTPNGDGINEKWIVTNGSSCTTQIAAKVYNRYGNLVYSNDNYTNNWDGTYKGKPIPDGTYYYVLIYKLINNKIINLKGDVTILR